MTISAPILLVESDRDLAEELARELMADGYRVELAGSARHARLLATECPPRLAMLGAVEAPRGALSLLEEIREAHGDDRCWDHRLPVLVICPQHEGLDVLRAFDAGADDVMTVLPGYLELRARMRAVLRRSELLADRRGIIEVRELRIDLPRRRAELAGQPLALRRMEFELLACLAREPDRTFTREELLHSIWGYRAASSTRTVDSHASRVRRKLVAVRPGPWVVGVWGVGYRLT